MKQLGCIALSLLLYTGAVTAQPFAWAFPDSGIVWDQSSTWGWYGGDYGGTNHQVYPDGSDTIIEGKRFVKLFHTGNDFHVPLGSWNFFHEPYGFFRNDTLNETAEVRMGSYTFLYRSDWEVGDTIDWGFRGQSTIVTAIDTILMGGISRKVLFYEQPGGGADHFLIEGIGPCTGLGEGPFTSDLDYGARLNCVHVNDSSYRMEGNPSVPEYTATSCGDIPDNISTVNKIPLTLSPNPVSDKLVLRIGSGRVHASIEIQSVYGQSMYSEVLGMYYAEQIISTSSYPPGAYVAIVKSDAGIGVTKFLIAR